jgi:YHS domain-containing protein
MGTIGYLLFWAVLFFVMMRFGCGAHVMGHHHHRHRDAPSGGSGDGPWSAPAEARDPVCGKLVPTASAKSSLWEGHAYYFCSQDCRDTFEAAPRTFLGNVPTVHQGAA